MDLVVGVLPLTVPRLIQFHSIEQHPHLRYRSVEVRADLHALRL